jgi:hypothetical protein
LEGNSLSLRLQTKPFGIIEMPQGENKLPLLRVRKLIGKPGGHTSPDRQFDAGRIHVDNYETGSLHLATNSKALRIHSDLLCRDVAIAACISLFSSGDTRAWTRMPRSLAFGTFGLPIFGFIKYFVYDNNNC